MADVLEESVSHTVQSKDCGITFFLSIGNHIWDYIQSKQKRPLEKFLLL
jgi:hypothetical protein